MNHRFKKFVFDNFRKGSYYLVSQVIGKEEIYRRNNRIVVIIEDEEVGKRIFNVVKSLKQWNETISSNHIDFKITDFVTDDFNTVQILFANMNSTLKNSWKQIDRIDQLRELISFAHGMQEKGYIIDDSIFDNETCSNISDFLSFFKCNGTEKASTNGCLIKYVHHVLSPGENMEEYYHPLIKENEIRKLDKFPYHLPVIQMCYNYCLNGIIPEDIDSVLANEKNERYIYGNYYQNKLIVSNADLSDNLSVTESTDTYTVYDERIKIHKNISSEFENFLEDEDGFLLLKTQNNVEECIVNRIIDFEGNIIGYEYQLKADPKASTIFNISFDSQRHILTFISSMRKYLHKILEKAHPNFKTDTHEFNIETDLICNDPANDFKISKIESLFKLVLSSSEKIDEDITRIFFKLLLDYLEKTYGNISDRQTLYEKKEVRYLSPLLAKEFCKFVLEEKVNISIATEEFVRFIVYDMQVADENLVYDRDFSYNPSKNVPFLFEHEAESKYGLEIREGTRQRLPDGSILVALDRRENIYTLRTRINSLEDKCLRFTFNKYVEVVDISQIIYSLDIDSNDLYYVLGYVTTPILGKPLTTKRLLGFSNKEILKITGMLVYNFDKYYIHWSNIYMDNNEERYKFYINKFDKNFEVLKSNFRSKREFIESFLKELLDAGYNENAFIDVNLYVNCLFDDLENKSDYLIDCAEKMDAYCEDHKIYYDSSNLLCPICQKTLHIIKDNFNEQVSKDFEVFEDRYAIHYESSHQYNLKIYKEDCVDMAQMEENIDKILNRSIRGKSSQLQQDCFLPCKKILDGNRKFVGYLYNSVDFENSDFRNLKDTECLENLPRINSLIRLILQVKELMEKPLNFTQNPFGNVFLSITHKKQVQIVNVEFLSRKGKRKDTIKWTCEYIRNVITSDNHIDININTVDWKEDDLDYILYSLRQYAKTLTMYCPIHKFYYSNDYLFCPECVDKSLMKKSNIVYVNSSNIDNWKEFNNGGESIIYEYGDNGLAKIFREERIDYSIKSRILAGILSKTEILENINRQGYKFKYIIPKEILVDKDNHKILGYVMDDKVIGEPVSILCDKKERSSLGISRKEILEILITIGEGVQTLHDKANIFIGDLNGRNILFDKDKNVYFLDFDGMGIDNISPLFWTADYIDPISVKNKSITKKDDWYSFAVQAFYYLTCTHPFNGIYELDNHVLEIPKKMELRISLLGDHDIKIPSIAIPWDWMSCDLKNTFLNIFEGEVRKSIVPELKAQYQSLYGSEGFHQIHEEGVIPIGSKFIAKKRNPFHGEVVRILNEHSAICNDSEKYYTSILAGDVEYRVHFPNCMQIMDILLLDNNSIAFAVYDHEIIGFELRTDRQIFCEDIYYNSDDVVVNENTLYLNKENTIYQIEFNSMEEIKRRKIRFLADQETVGFLVEFNSKFVLVKRTYDGKDKIYCNSQELCEINSDSNSKYNILYDDTTKMWLVINSNGKFVTIKSSNGHYVQGKIDSGVNEVNVKNINFAKGVIYIPSQDNVYIINAMDQMTTKKMECDKIMTPDSRLCNFNSHGFSVITDYILYDISLK